jgi:uncharacterized membrane protein (DUF106 family)
MTVRSQPSPTDPLAPPGDEAVVVRAPPTWMWMVWVALGIATGVQGLDELTGVGGVAHLDDWLHNAVVAAAAALCLVRAAYEPGGRVGWAAFGAALACWATGDLLWSVLYGADARPPYPTVADVLWLAWYPLGAVGLAGLIRTRVHGFELHRWMDGLAVMLIVIIPGSVFVVQPVAQETDNGTLASSVDFSYPILDVLLLGALLGVYGLLAWRPGRMWLVLGLGLALITVSDAASAVAQARDVSVGDWDFTWTAGALLIAAAAWVSGPGHTHAEVYGWRAIALAVAAQVLAGVIQVYGLFHEIGPSERFVTLAVLAIATTQIILSRPRAPGG